MTWKQSHGLEEISAFLSAVDRNLTRRSTVVIIGGGAAVFHQSQTTTSDVDTYDALNQELEEAIEKASIETGLRIPVQYSPVAQVPWNFQDRLERRLPELETLQVWCLKSMTSP